MKDIINTNKMYLMLFLLFLIKNFAYVESFIIKLIQDTNINTTASFVYLHSLEKENYLYFSYDFNYHN